MNNEMLMDMEDLDVNVSILAFNKAENDKLKSVLGLALDSMDEQSYEMFYHTAINGMDLEQIAEFNKFLNDVKEKYRGSI